MTTKYSRGSEWRKWDLHIHTPLSIVQGYGGDTQAAWDSYINKLQNLSDDVKVIGITDYFFIDGYQKLLTYKEKLNKFDLILPNIEFRLDIFSENNKRLNLHILFDPIVKADKIQEQLLNCLSKAYLIQDGAEWEQCPTKQTLVELGKKIKSTALNNLTLQNKTDLEVGFENITYKIDDIFTLLEKDCFKGKFVASLGYTEWADFKWNQSAAEKRTVANKISFFLTNNNSEEQIKKHKEDLRNNNLKDLIFHSSDAHNIDSIGKTKLWIKADPTFSGLKQVLNDTDRVFIGDNKPITKNDYSYIKDLHISNSHNWFEENLTISLNQDLVTIIGGRGSGKSALIEMIALGAHAVDPSSESFINKAINHKQSLEGATVELIWGNNDKSTSTVGKREIETERVQFLPQKAVEELCSPSGNKQLMSQIENVIFNSLDETDKMGCTSFQDLLGNILTDYQMRKNGLRKKVSDQIELVLANNKKISSLKEKEKLSIELKQSYAALEKELIKLPEADKQEQNQLMKLMEFESRISNKIVEIRQKKQKVDSLETSLNILKNNITETEAKINIELEQLGIDLNTDKSRLTLTLDTTTYVEVFKQIKNKSEDEIRILLESVKSAEIAKILSDNSTDLVFENYTVVKSKIKTINDKTKDFESLKSRYQLQQKQLFDIKKQYVLLDSEIQDIKTNDLSSKPKLLNDLFDKYKEIFDILSEEQKKLQLLYKPLQETLNKGTDLDKLLLFNADISYDIETQTQKGDEIIDHNKKGNFKNSEILKESLNEFWKQIKNTDFDIEAVKNQIFELIRKFTHFENTEISISSQLKNNFTVSDFYNWIFDIDYFTVTTSIDFNNTDLNVLSPGQKGIVLLMLYLAIDKSDKRPLLIDQPEDNLDNLSIYNDIIQYFRQRKLERQIIVVTHNPNLVVNTDSEQVIIANYNGKTEPRITYCSGSLENHMTEDSDVSVEQWEDGILEQVCNILEGGDFPFKQRKNKYRLSPKIKLE